MTIKDIIDWLRNEVLKQEAAAKHYASIEGRGRARGLVRSERHKQRAKAHNKTIGMLEALESPEPVRPVVDPVMGLLPCPFCGSAASYRVDEDDSVTVWCDSLWCGAEVSDCYQPEEAKAAWNRRTPCASCGGGTSCDMGIQARSTMARAAGLPKSARGHLVRNGFKRRTTHPPPPDTREPGVPARAPGSRSTLGRGSNHALQWGQPAPEEQWAGKTPLWRRGRAERHTRYLHPGARPVS